MTLDGRICGFNPPLRSGLANLSASSPATVLWPQANSPLETFMEQEVRNSLEGINSIFDWN